MIGMVDYDGHLFKQLTYKGGLHLYPTWLPNTHSIAYISYKGEDLWLYRLDIPTNKLSVISKEPGLNLGAEWSPDGKEVVLTLTKEGNPELYLLRGTKLKRLTLNNCIDTSPTWSPNGRELAFVSDRSGSPQIYIMSRDGTNVRRLTFDGDYNTSPAWSPKGDRIAYVSREEDGSFQIYTILVNGEENTCLTWAGNNEDPSWSPDGLHLCFISDRNGKCELFTMHWDGSNQRRVASILDGCYTPSWSRY
jgi:TolB protein